MKLKDFRFKLTNIETKESAILSFDDIFGYEGEDNGVFVCHDRKHIPESLQDEAINYNSGYGYMGLNEIWDIEYVTPADGKNANEQ